MSERSSGRSSDSSDADAIGRVHTIRLHAAWTRHDGDRGGPADPRKVSLPDETLVASSAAAVVYTRRFNRPTGIVPRTVITLESGWLGLASAVTLNGHVFAGNATDHWDITDLLRPHNVLEVAIPASRFSDAAVETVRLSITDRD